MPRRYIEPEGERFLANRNTMEVHDLDNEKSDCQIDDVIRTGNDVTFYWLQEAMNGGYHNCDWCFACCNG